MYYTRINKSQEIFLPKLLCVFLYKSVPLFGCVYINTAKKWLECAMAFINLDS